MPLQLALLEIKNPFFGTKMIGWQHGVATTPRSSLVSRSSWRNFRRHRRRRRRSNQRQRPKEKETPYIHFPNTSYAHTRSIDCRFCFGFGVNHRCRAEGFVSQIAAGNVSQIESCAPTHIPLFRTQVQAHYIYILFVDTSVLLENSSVNYNIFKPFRSSPDYRTVPNLFGFNMFDKLLQKEVAR